MNDGVGVMARPRQKPEREQPPPEPGNAERADVTVINLKGSRSYVKWLQERHKETHIAKATLWRLAMAEYAAKRGWPPPPEI